MAEGPALERGADARKRRGGWEWVWEGVRRSNVLSSLRLFCFSANFGTASTNL